MTMPTVETSADLRRLYRDAEARATRLRALLDTSRTLATARGDALDHALYEAAERAARLAGHRRGALVVSPPMPATGLWIVPLLAPGDTTDPVGWLVFDSALGPTTSPAAEDADAVALIAQLMAAAIAARHREARLAELLDRLLAVQERERAHVARELHDGLAQLATAALRRIELAAAVRADDETRRAADLTRDLVGELRRVIAGMRPTALDDLGLDAAVTQLAAALEEAACTVTLSLDAPLGLPADHEIALYRVAQESLANVRRHAAPCTVAVSLAHDRAARTLVLTVRDTGPGFDPATLRDAAGNGHFGIAFMRERLRALGGTLTLATQPAGGCTVVATVPLP